MTIELLQCLAVAFEAASKMEADKKQRSQPVTPIKHVLPKTERQRKDTASFYSNILNS